MIFSISCTKSPAHNDPSHVQPSSDLVEASPKSGERERQFGMDRFRETWVYLDGNPISVLSFHELPRDLQVTVIKDRVSAPKEYGDSSPGWEWSEQKRYRFVDYIAALGIDLADIQEIQILGPKGSDVMVAKGEELRTAKGKELMFRFGNEDDGKAIPVFPPNFGNGKSPDKIAAVTLYQNKKPPLWVRNVGLVLDGQPVRGIAYHGEPVRGGVRVYIDNQLVTVIKRKKLDTIGESGKSNKWNLHDYLRDQGVTIPDITNGWVYGSGDAKKTLKHDDISSISFWVNSKGKIMLTSGESSINAQAIMLFSES